jgi:hypothetical protein
MSHMSVLGPVGIGLFWEKDLFWKRRSIFGVRALGGRKATCRKRRKSNAGGKVNMAHM